jgi:MFS transporter, putative metabolite:H+ symporter
MTTDSMLSFYDAARPGWRYYVIFATVCAGFCLDFYDFYIVGFLLASLGPQWHLTYFQSAMILLSGGVGSIVGALLFGALADRYGRKPVLLTATAICAVSAGAISLVPEGDWWWLSVLRVLVGAGLGGVGATLAVILAELTPAPMRVKLMGWPLIFPSVGTLIAASTTAALIAALGWRGVAALGLMPVLLCIPFFFLMPESPRWLVAKLRMDEARAAIAGLAGVPLSAVPATQEVATEQPSVSLTELYQRPRRFWFVVLIFLTISTASYGVYLWGPTITSMILDVAVAEAATYFVYISLTGLLGRVAFSIIPAMVGRVWSGRLIGLGIACALCGAALMHTEFLGSVPWFVIFLAIGAIFYDGGYCTLAPYMPELFPTRLAARGSGLSQGANGLGKILGPLCLALIAGSNNLVSAKATEEAILPAFLFLAACGAILGLCFIRAPETRDKALSLNETDSGEETWQALAYPKRQAASGGR